MYQSRNKPFESPVTEKQSVKYFDTVEDLEPPKQIYVKYCDTVEYFEPPKQIYVPVTKQTI